VRLSPIRSSATVWPIVRAPDDRWWVWSSRWNGNWQEKTCPTATLSTTNLPWPDLDSNPDRRGGKLATNLLSYGPAYHKLVILTLSFLFGKNCNVWGSACYLLHSGSLLGEVFDLALYRSRQNSPQPELWKRQVQIIASALYSYFLSIATMFRIVVKTVIVDF
jgi:hypothetical protein